MLPSAAPKPGLWSFSPEDQKNPLLRRLADIIEYLETNHQPIPIQQFASQPDFPACALAHLVQIGDVIGKVVEVDREGGKFALIDTKTGKRRPFRTAGIIAQYGQPARPVSVAAPLKETLLSTSSSHKMTPFKDQAPQIIGNPKGTFLPASSQEMTHLKDKASKIVGNPNVYYWTPLERKAVRAQLGTSGLGDAELARQFLQALTPEEQV